VVHCCQVVVVRKGKLGHQVVQYMPRSLCRQTRPADARPDTPANRALGGMCVGNMLPPVTFQEGMGSCQYM
jgi:hypothetical protein